ncbi:molybdate transport system substrate-binding protein [Sphingomonas gellani]|uniref:Molybdate transport system substrate-binding protein n=1 Tax=Sphingomonas gellani TaxID=1166340 RepID=A0A1H7Z2L1_9SPHN|nr:molybdate ABC transporter substrate-binding protein [Sphingomonas gellani]SEM51707.1 molybdate transport system substrate-binding protein [Sphingomonas gellani]
MILSLFRRFALALLMLAVAPAVLAEPAARSAPLVLAAASMQEAMSAAADEWARRGHVRPVIAFAASSALARQAQAGGRADLFVSADEQWMDVLARGGLIVPGTRADLVRNRLVVVAPVGRGERITVRRIATILSAGPLAMADPRAVPAGRYGEAALTRLGVWQSVAPHVVRAADVRAALALVERGAAPYGIVYATDARASRKVRVVGVFPADSHPPILYPVARLRNGVSPDAEGFRRFLLSPAGRAIFARFGFAAA